MRLYPHLSFLLLCLSIRALVSDATARCMPHGSGSAQLRIIDPPPFASITLPVTITVCVPPHMLHSESADHTNVSLLLTVNTLVFNQTGIRSEVTFSIDQSVSENLNIGMVAYPSLEFCVYVVAVDAAARPLFGSAYSCVLTSASSPPPPIYPSPCSLPLLTTQLQTPVGIQLPRSNQD
jgi:hypothetical protein